MHHIHPSAMGHAAHREQRDTASCPVGRKPAARSPLSFSTRLSRGWLFLCLGLLLALSGLALLLPGQALALSHDATLGRDTPHAPATPPAPAKKPGAYRTLDWGDLIPAAWDPVKIFEDLNLDELDDEDPRADEAMEKLRKLWDEAPANQDLDGVSARIPGYVVPLDFSRDAELKEFLLVPYFGACIHVPPPPANQIIHVTLSAPSKGIRVMDAVWVNGVMTVRKADTDMGVSGYALKADSVEVYVHQE